MIFLDSYFRGVADVSRLGFPISNPEYIPFEYLENKEFLIFRTCHSYGDWVILSAMPRLLKEKYPDCKVYLPSHSAISQFFSPNQWQNRSNNPFNNVSEIFLHNPFIDGFISEVPTGLPVFHDHFRIYDLDNLNVPLVQQMLKFWRFNESEMIDCAPELYWSKEEITEGDEIISSIFGKNDFGFLYLDDSFFYSISLPMEELNRRRSLIQKEIHNHSLSWLYYTGNDSFHYKTNNKIFNVADIKMSLRVQNYVKSKSRIIIGHQGGYGTDCMSRYSKCYVVPHNYDSLNEHMQYNTTYLN